jgi:uncharacterized RmlC-like cupin family protein
MSKYLPITIVSPAQFDRGTAQTPGSQREAALAPALGVQTGLWGGIFIVDPGAKTGIHHHGAQETIAYVLEGECEVRWGERGEFSAHAKAGDFIHVPPLLPPHGDERIAREIIQMGRGSFDRDANRDQSAPYVLGLSAEAMQKSQAIAPLPPMRRGRINPSRDTHP